MELKGKKVLVTGGAGFIGSNLVDALVAGDNQVTVIDDLSTGKLENLDSAVRSGKLTMVTGSILDQKLMRQYVPGVQVVFHLAVQCLRLSFDRPYLVHEVNATGTLNLLEACSQLAGDNLERFVYVSSSEVYGSARQVPMTEEHQLEPTTVYGASKLAGELYTAAHHTTFGMPTVIARPFNTYGFREHHEGASGEIVPRSLVRILCGLPPVIFGNGTQTRDFTFVTDAVEGLIRAACAESLVGQVVNIAYGQEVSIKEIVDLMLAELGREELGIDWQSPRPADVARHFADVSRLDETTGFRPAIDIKQGLKHYIDWFQERYPYPSVLLPECEIENWKVENAEVLW